MTPAGFQRLRMILLAGSIAVVGLVLWLASGYGLGHATYTAPDLRFRFRYPDGYKVRYEETGDSGHLTVSACAHGSGPIRAFTVLRYPGWAKAIVAADRPTATQAFLDQFLQGQNPQVRSRGPVQRAYGAGQRLEATATFQGAAATVALEVVIHGDDLYLFSIEGADHEILNDPEGAQFLESIALQ